MRLHLAYTLPSCEVYAVSRNFDDFDLCVANERLEEIIAFKRSRLFATPIEDAMKMRFSKDDAVFVRSSNAEFVENLVRKLEGTKLYPDLKKRENLEYWWRHIPPVTRKFTEFTIKEIYETSKEQWKPELREVLTNPVFIKIAKKRDLRYFSHWKGEDYLDAFGFSIESAPYESVYVATPLITKKFREYRCWVYENRVLSCSLYEDYYYIGEIISPQEEALNRKKVQSFLETHLFAHPNREKFPPLLVVDVFVFEDGVIDFVEFNNYEQAGRYVYNSIQPVIVALCGEECEREEKMTAYTEEKSETLDIGKLEIILGGKK